MAIKSPLANMVRPRILEEFVGQEHLVGEGKPLRKMIESKEVPSSIILWGPPGCGKTTIARLISRLTNSEFFELSAVNSKKEDIQKVVNQAKLFNNRLILFLDEIHRFNKTQQDFLLPYVEKGIITLIGATTENPSFEIISALLSRSQLFKEKKISKQKYDSLKDKRRFFLDEFDEKGRNRIVDFFIKHKIKIVADIIKGNDKFAADWMLVTKYNKSDDETTWILRDINYAMDVFGNGEVRISERGSLYIGRITMQRKGGDAGRNTANMLQFKISPCDLFKY